MISMNRPSRGEREPVTTTRYVGRLVVPVRLNLMETGTSSPPQCGKARKLRAGHLALQPLELLHHPAELPELLEEPIDVLHARAAPARDALAAAAVDRFRMTPLTRRHGSNDGVEAAQIGLLGIEALRNALPLQHLAEGQHPQHLVERAELPDLLELLAEVL